MTWIWHPRVLLAPGLVLILVAIGGRYTLDRAGFTDLAWVDLRVIGLVVGLVALTVDVARRPRRPRGEERREGWLVAATLFFVFQIASGLWAPDAARVGPQTLDLVLMAALVLAFYLYATGDPEAVIRTAFLLFYVAAILFALAALASGPGEQGRYSAFGGGPNVFVRIQLLGVISAIALTMFTRRRLPLVAIPLFLLTAVLSGSRAGLLAGLVVGAAALWKIRRKLTAGVVVAVTGVLALAGGVIGLLAPPAFTSLFQERFVEQTVQERYLSDRTDIWGAAWRLAVDHPLTGTGLDGFYGTVGVNQRVEYPHNYVLGVAAEGGLAGIGLLALAVLLWIATVRGGGRRPRMTGPAVASAALVALCSLFSGDYYDARLFWLFAALAAAAAVMPVPAARDREAVPA